jgi:hypothetical protein
MPYISFQVYPDRIVTECNEDGFAVPDLEAICAVGRSTKSTSYGYIGAKGIGFKSVFIAASEVYIQSGNFKFSFRHAEGDDGLGMLTPLWREDDKVLPGSLTRMTLYFHRKGDSKRLEHLRDTINKQFEDLQQTSLLFLRKLKQIKISFHTLGGSTTSSKIFSCRTHDDRRIVIKTETGSADSSVQDSHYYHLIRHMAIGLPASNNRDSSGTNEMEKSPSTVEVVLAFPLKVDSSPLIGREDIFAFLPIRNSNFKVCAFPIQGARTTCYVLILTIFRSSSYSQTLIQVRIDKM